MARARGALARLRPVPPRAQARRAGTGFASRPAGSSSIEKVGRKQAQCIKLDSANELYVTDDFIVTHNTFIGVDVLIVRYMARKAKRLAAKWGGQCIVFIDEIDAVAMRRSSLGASMTASTTGRYDDHCFYGPNGSLTRPAT